MPPSPSAAPADLLPGALLAAPGETEAHVSGTRSTRVLPTGLRVSGWLEFLVVGGATFLLFPLSWALQRAFGADPVLLAAGFLTFHAAYVLNDPHFAVTYLLFYREVRRRALSPELPLGQRFRYWLSGFVVPVVLVTWAALALALHSAAALGWIVQLMFLLVGWHYAKQGFGVLSVLSARRGVSLNGRERRLLLWHCFAGWAFAWANPSRAAGEFEEKGVVYWGVAHPRWLELTAGAVLAASTLALGAQLVRSWQRERRALPFVPLSSFLITIWSWTIYSRVDPMVQYLIPALHSLQYFYFVWLMQGNRAISEEGPPLFGRAASARLGMLALSALGLGWLLLRGGPTLLDELLVPRLQRGGVPDELGTTPYFAAFFAMVNIHHYCMDHVIWRRENPETRFLRAATQ